MAQTTSAEDLVERLREAAGRNPTTERLFAEAEEYLKAQGKNLVSRLAGGGSGAIGRGAAEMLKGGSPLKAAAGTAAQGAKDAVGGLVSKARRGTGGQKATVISETVDVGVPVSTAYNQWTQFAEFGSFMKGVENVDQQDDANTDWHVKIGPSRRTWKGHIVEQVPDRRIVWESEGAKGSTKGVVTFHPLCDDLTQLCVVMEYYPAGLVEKAGNLFHLAGRRVRLDLQQYRRHIMLQGSESGAWRGEIRGGKVVHGGNGRGDEDGHRRSRGKEPAESGRRGR